jgi:hypothetical protein
MSESGFTGLEDLTGLKSKSKPVVDVDFDFDVILKILKS